MELGGRTPASRSCCADYEHFDACEDAAQEALLAAAVKWPDQGIPANPGAG
jgi:predicted RNA polymerase sigma factor